MCMVAIDSLVPGTLTHSLVSTIQRYREVNTVDESADELTVNINWYLDYGMLMELQHLINPASRSNDNIRVSRAVNDGYDVRIRLTAWCAPIAALPPTWQLTNGGKGLSYILFKNSFTSFISIL